MPPHDTADIGASGAAPTRPAVALPAPAMLYDQPMAPNPRRLNIAIAEKGLTIPRTAVDLMAGEHKAEGYLAAVGVPVVPALVLEDGTVLTETVAIARYLDAICPEPNLCGRTPLETAEIEMWQRRVEFGLFQSVAACFRHTNRHLAVLEDQVAAWGEINRGRIRGHLERLDARLAGRTWLAADRLSVADITAIVAVEFMRVIKEPLPGSDPGDLMHLAAWVARMQARPAVTASHPQKK
ncbi:MAG: glutathione S-transferase [Pseudomonadota bacterium]